MVSILELYSIAVTFCCNTSPCMRHAFNGNQCTCTSLALLSCFFEARNSRKSQSTNYYSKLWPISSIFTRMLAKWAWNSVIVKYADSIAALTIFKGNKSTNFYLISVCEAALLIILWLTIVFYPGAYLFFEIACKTTYFQRFGESTRSVSLNNES